MAHGRRRGRALTAHDRASTVAATRIVAGLTTIGVATLFSVALSAALLRTSALDDASLPPSQDGPPRDDDSATSTGGHTSIPSPIAKRHGVARSKVGGPPRDRRAKVYHPCTQLDAAAAH